MKKFLIIIIFLIPVIVIVAIQGAGAAIEAFAPAVNAESIEIRDSFNENVSGGRVIVPRFMKDGNDGYVYVYINVYPSVAYSDKIEYKVLQEQGYDGECKLERVEKTKYRITAQKNGSVLMRIFSVTNDNAYTMLNIYVTSELITDLSIYTESNDGMIKVNEAQEIDYSQNLKLYAHASPAEAIGNNLVHWESNNEDIAVVDKNGLVSPIGEGRAKITARLLDKTGNEHFTFMYVNIYENMILRNQLININKEFLLELDNEERKEYILNNIVLKNNNKENKVTVDDIEFVSQSDRNMIFSVKGMELVFNYVNKNDIVLKSDYLNEIYFENGGYTLITEYADFSRKEKPNIKYTVSDNAIVEINNNLIIPKKEGECIIYAVDQGTGKRTDNLRITVKRRVYSFQLNLSNMDNVRGIKQERVWGQYWFENDTLTNSFTLGYNQQSVHPYTSNLELLWQTSDQELATINNEGKITFYPQSIGKEITVTAYALVHGIKSELVRSYTFKMSPKEDAVNVYNLEQFEKANSQEKGKRPVALHGNITINEARELKANNSIFGNGYLIYFIFPDGDYRFRDTLRVRQEDINKEINEIILENFTVQCDDNYIGGQLKGEALFLSDMEIPSIIRYVISRFTYTSIHIARNKSVTTIEGCILGNAGFAAIYFADDYIDDLSEAGTMIVRNTVFRETGCASLVTTPASLDTNISKNYVQNIKIEGFIDSYNWKRTNELHGIFNSIDSSSFGPLSNARDALSNMLANMLENLLQQEEYSRLVYTDEKGQKWVSMNMFALGLSEKIDPKAFDLSQTEELELMDLPLPKGMASIFKTLLGFSFNEPCYLLNYKFDEKRGPVIKPNDACPENEELFKRLMS